MQSNAAAENLEEPAFVQFVYVAHRLGKINGEIHCHTPKWAAEIETDHLINFNSSLSAIIKAGKCFGVVP